uniref:Uncharacterized protein n=1 Tax=Timema shepardi TaxID=629360 RepID=A0A7R9BA11_TIMSH|nr:unnamed protein product [Timema shepardi]
MLANKQEKRHYHVTSIVRSARLEISSKLAYSVSALTSTTDACTGIEDVAEAIFHLDECDWDLLVRPNLT